MVCDHQRQWLMGSRAGISCRACGKTWPSWEAFKEETDPPAPVHDETQTGEAEGTPTQPKGKRPGNSKNRAQQPKIKTKEDAGNA